MTDNVAILEGYTAEVYAEFHGQDFHFLVKPETDLSQYFRAWDMDSQQFGTVKGYNADTINYC